MGAVGTGLSLPSPWDVARGTCCRALKVPGHQLAPGPGPGCWWAAATACPGSVPRAPAQPRLSIRWERAPGTPLAASPSAPGPSPPRPLFPQVAGRWEGWECGTGAGAAAARRVRPQDGAALLRLRPGQLPDQRDAHGGWVGGVRRVWGSPWSASHPPGSSLRHPRARPCPLCQVPVGRADAPRTCPPGWHEGASGAGHVRDALSGGIWLIGAPVPRDEWRRARSRRKRWGWQGAGERLMSPDSWQGWGRRDRGRVPISPQGCAHPPSLLPSRSSPRAPRMTRATKASAGRTWAASSSASATTSRSPP